jgi:hypothetical protein
LTDLLAERRLAQVEPLRGLPEMQGVRDGDDVAKVSKFHFDSHPNVLHR